MIVMSLERNRIVVVCTGNTCRSPMAEKLLAHALAAEDPPLNSIDVVSAGVSAYPGEPASGGAVRALAKVGLDLTAHRSRSFEPSLAEKALLILAMRESHRAYLKENHPDLGAPVLLFREPMGDPENAEVCDPFGGDFGRYLEARDSLAEAVPALIRHIRSLV